ncbi:MAG TPA: FecR domain-containing protein [Steroidobacteraceae bacterium]|nr:FecR domain-containing protein [Steroidobacteraceae bacterium]
MRRQNGKRYAPEIYERACEWFVEFRTAPADEEVRHEFYAWLQQAPAHMAAYLDVASRWKWTDALDVSVRFPKEALIAQARDSDNLVAYPGAQGSSKTRPRLGLGSWLRPPARWALAGGAAALIATVLVIASLRGGPVYYSTGIGQKRVVTLADGSTIRLNARSRIRVRYTKSRREIDLLRGQALFVDTYEPNRPFIVRSRATVVRAIGTQFDVNLLRAETIVTVIQGKVAVAQQQHAFRLASRGPRAPSLQAASNDSLVYLTAGQQLTVTPTWHMRPVRANVTDTIAWTHRQLIFSSTALRDVVQEFNRFNDRRLIIASPSLDTFRIDGVFSSTNPQSLIAFLRQYPGIKVTDTGREVVISRQ